MIRVGIIGFGRIGKEHAGWLAACSNARAVAVFDPTAARREMAVAKGLKAFDSLDALFAEVDAVLVSTPTAFHFEHATAALAAGRHVMVEKPITLDYPTAKTLVEDAEARGLVLSVFHNRRFDADYLTVADAIGRGAVGRVINVESRLGQWASCVGPAAKEWRPGWRNEASFGGGGLYDWGSHFVDQLWRLMLPAKPTHVFAQLRGNVWSADCDDFARVLINFDSNAVGMVEINTTTKRPGPRWHIDGTAGSAESPSDAGFDVKRWAEMTVSNSDDGEAPWPAAEQGESESQIWDAFAGAAAGRGRPSVEPRSVLMTMRILDAARESSRRSSVQSLE